MSLITLLLALGLVNGAHSSSSQGIAESRGDAQMEDRPNPRLTREEYFASKGHFRHNREAPRVFRQAGKKVLPRRGRKRTRTDRDDRKMQAAYLPKKTRLNPEILLEEQLLDIMDRGRDALHAASKQLSKEDFEEHRHTLSTKQQHAMAALQEYGLLVRQQMESDTILLAEYNAKVAIIDLESAVLDVELAIDEPEDEEDSDPREIEDVPFQSTLERDPILTQIRLLSERNLPGSLLRALDELIVSIEKAKRNFPQLWATLSGKCYAAVNLIEEGMDGETLNSIVTRINILTDELELEILAAHMDDTRLG